MNGPIRIRNAEAEARQARFALRVVSHLAGASEQLPHDLSERLRVARERAVARARHVRLTQTAAAGALHAGGGSLALAPPPSIWLRLASLMPLVVLLSGLILIQHLHTRAEIHAAAEVDAALLADDLPPEAYGDPGFALFLKLPEQ